MVAFEEEDFLGEIPDAPPKGKFTNREGYEGGGAGQTPGTGGGGSGAGNGGGSGSYTPIVTPGTYESPPGTVQNVGYEVLVLAGPNFEDAIALIASHQGLQISRGISMDGGGSITLNRDSPLFYNEPVAPTNLILNPDFKTSRDGSYAWGWQVNSRATPTLYGTTDTWLGVSDSPNRSLYLYTPGTGNAQINTLEGTAGIHVTPHVNMTFTAQARPSSTGRPTRLYVDFYDSGGNYLGVGKSLWGVAIITEPGVTNYLRLDGAVPDGAVYASAGVEVVATGLAGEQHRFDNFAFHPTMESTPFYDGRDKSDIIDKENLWEVYYNGQRIHEFIGTVRSSDLVNPAESRTVTVAGAGTMDLLKRVRVLPQEWKIRDGKPWLVKPMKELKVDLNEGINTRQWNKKVTMNVAVDYSDATTPKLQIMNYDTKQTEMVGTGPWDLKYDAHLEGDQSGIPNTLYFQAYPFLLPTPAPTLDDQGSTVYIPADFQNVYEIYIDDNNRCYAQVRSTLTEAGVKTDRIYVWFFNNDKTGTKLTGDIPYSEVTHRWLQFRVDDMNRFMVECSADGRAWNPLASQQLGPATTVWNAMLDQVTFRVYSYFSGIPHAYHPWTARPKTGSGMQGYTPSPAGSTTPTELLPIGKITDAESSFDNPAFNSIARINDNGVPDTKSPLYDQMGYFWWRAKNAKATRGVLADISFDWTAGNYREGITDPGFDSIGNRRRGLTQTYFKTGDADQVNSLFVTGPVVTPVPTGVTMDGSWLNAANQLVYNKYTYKDPMTNAETEAFIVKVKVTEPVDGQTFYDYFVQSCNIAKCDWTMRPGRSLQIIDSDPDLSGLYAGDRRWDPVVGIHKEDMVLFHEGYSTISKQMARSSESIVNYVIGHDSKGNYEVAKDDASIAKWGIREAWVPVDYNDPTTVSLQTAVSTVLQIGVNEVESWTISVPVLDGVRPFVDYKEGDWVSIAKHTGADPQSQDYQYDFFRVMAISLSVGINNEETVELTLTSLVETQIKQLTDKLNNVNPTSQAAVTSIPPTSSYAQITSTNLGTLGNVSVEDAAPGSFLRLNNAGVWVAQPPEAVPKAIKNTYRSGKLGDGSSTSYTITHNLGTTSVVIRVLRWDGTDVTGFYAMNSGSLVRSAIPVVVDANTIKVNFNSAAGWATSANGSTVLTLPQAADPHRRWFSVIVMRGDDSSTWK